MAFRIKNILKEIDSNPEKQQRIEELHHLINSGQYMNNRLLLIRGDGDSPRYFKKKKIRKDRRPKDTLPIIDEFIEIIRRKRFPNKPSRRKVKFAAAVWDERGAEKMKPYIQDYGTPHVVFPEKNAPVVSIERDSYKVFGPLRKNYQNAKHMIHVVRSAKQEDEFVDSFPELYDFIVAMGESNVPDERIIDYFEGDFPVILTQLEALRISNIFDRDVVNAASQMNQMFDVIFQYFNNLNDDISPGDQEVLFGGDYYLLVDWEFFLDNFDYYEGTNSWVNVETMQQR